MKRREVDIKLVQTSPVVPEQYDAINGKGETVGYLHLRHGTFRVEVPDVGGKTVFAARPKGYGAFDDNEREYFLNQAVAAIKSSYLSKI